MSGEKQDANLSQLLTELIDGGLNDQKWEMLHDLLESDEAAVKIYVAHVRLHANLQQELGARHLDHLPELERLILESGSVDLLAPKHSNHTKHSHIRGLKSQHKRPFSGWLIIAACLGFLALVFTAYVQMKERETPVLATVLRADSAMLQEGQLRSGDHLSGKSINLLNGELSLRLQSGATITLYAPASFQLKDERGGELSHGRLLGKVQDKSQGLWISGPDFKVSDLGTAFIVDCQADQSQVYVLSGAVSYGALHGEPAIVKAGEGYQLIQGQLSRADKTKMIERFAGINAFDVHVAESSHADGLLAYISLDKPVDQWRDLIKGQSLGIEGALYDQSQQAAYFDGECAISLGDRPDLMIDAPMTFETRIRLDEIESGRRRLFSVGQDTRLGWGVFLEELKGRENDCYVTFTHFAVADYHFREVAILKGQWLHLAFTVTENEVSLFVDGKKQHVRSRKISMLKGKADAFIGRLQDGREKFTGHVSHVAVYDRILTDEEILERSR